VKKDIESGQKEHFSRYQSNLNVLRAEAIGTARAANNLMNFIDKDTAPPNRKIIVETVNLAVDNINSALASLKSFIAKYKEDTGLTLRFSTTIIRHIKETLIRAFLIKEALKRTAWK
jgi:hypothetical protein